MTTRIADAITHSLWHDELLAREPFPRLVQEHETDVLVVGAGITGLSVAIELADRGHRVTVCEAKRIGAGTTAASTGHLDAHPEMGPQKLIDRVGRESAQHYTRLRLEAIDRIEKWSDAECDFQRVAGYLYSESTSDRDQLKRECEAARQIGLSATFSEQIPFPRSACGYRIDSLARIRMGNYLRRLINLAEQRGVTLFENTLVASPDGDHPNSAEAGDGSVRFQHLVGAVHTNVTGSLKLYAAIPAYQSYAIAARIRGSIEDALFWDNSEPYFYARQLRSDDPSMILVGGKDHRTGAGEERKRMGQLEQWIQERFEVEEVVRRWSAELFEPVDGLPMIGKAPGKENIWTVTGLSGVGLTLGTASAVMIADGIEGKPHPLVEPLSPNRTGLKSPANWLREQATTASNMVERILPAQSIDPEKVCEGQGCVGKLDGNHVAFYRDAEGVPHQLDPICPHMGGVLHFNEVEQTWDCPVHGGRFAADGKRLYGPPESDMEAIRERVK